MICLNTYCPFKSSRVHHRWTPSSAFNPSHPQSQGFAKSSCARIRLEAQSWGECDPHTLKTCCYGFADLKGCCYRQKSSLKNTLCSRSSSQGSHGRNQENSGTFSHPETSSVKKTTAGTSQKLGQGCLTAGRVKKYASFFEEASDALGLQFSLRFASISHRFNLLKFRSHAGSSTQDTFLRNRGPLTMAAALHKHQWPRWFRAFKYWFAGWEHLSKFPLDLIAIQGLQDRYLEDSHFAQECLNFVNMSKTCPFPHHSLPQYSVCLWELAGQLTRFTQAVGRDQIWLISMKEFRFQIIAPICWNLSGLGHRIFVVEHLSRSEARICRKRLS